MTRLIREHKAPTGAICPSKIETKGIWALDVDDDIWQDVGLLDDAPEPTPPPWLCDETVRDGIKALLERDRCLEEDTRLQKEYRAMREWFAEEWSLLVVILENTGELFNFL
jgi:hypothetical protein